MDKKAMAKRLAAVCVATALLAPGAPAADYYVANSGNNTNSGLSPATPWLLISRALSQAAGGDTIHIADGDYPERIVVSNAVTLLGANLYFAGNPPFARGVSRTVIRPPDGAPDSAVIMVNTNGVVVRGLTIDGDFDTNGLPDAKYGVYSTNRPLVVDHCIITNMAGYGILNLGMVPPPAPDDTASVRGYFGYNTIVGITHTNAGAATGIFLDQAPATCELNDIGWITGATARAGIYLHSCYYTSNMTPSLRVEASLLM